MATTKPIVVHYVTHRTVKDPGIPVALSIGTAGTSHFRAKVRDQIIDSTTLEDVVRQVTARLDATSSANVRWQPVILLTLAREGVLEQTDGRETAASASLSFRRFWIAPVPTPADGRANDHRGSWSGKIEAPWDATTPAAKLKRSTNCYLYFDGVRGAQAHDMYATPLKPDGTLALPCKVHPSGHTSGNAHLLDYTDATWAALTAIVRRMHEMRAQLTTMVESPAAIAALEGLGQQLLTASSTLILPAGDGDSCARVGCGKPRFAGIHAVAKKDGGHPFKEA